MSGNIALELYSLSFVHMLALGDEIVLAEAAVSTSRSRLIRSQAKSPPVAGIDSAKIRGLKRPISSLVI